MDKSGEKRESKDGFESFGSRTSSSSRSSSDTSSDEFKVGKECRSSRSPLGWPIRKAKMSKCSVSDVSEDNCKENSTLKKQGFKISEIDMMKERFAKLLLGEDMSGSGKGVCTAMAISNAITNLCATAFGQLWRLEPLPSEKKQMWQREIECLLSVGDHIVEFKPSWQTFPDGRKLEVMTCRPRADLFINLPALRKLDNMLIEILDSFTSSEYWYVDQGAVAPDNGGSVSFQKLLQRQEEKWWLPVPRVPAGGLQENTRKQLNHKRECANQILKAAISINTITLSEMEVPESYLDSLPKNGRTCLGDVIYRYITSEQFSSECLLDCLDLSSEHIAFEIANRVESSIYIWRRRPHSTKTTANSNRPSSKSSWEIVKDYMIDGDKRDLLAERAESLLLCLKQRFPGLTQTTLDTSKIQFNKDVGKSILESYSRVLESLAFNIVARIDDLLYVDELTSQSDRLSSVSTPKRISHKRVSSPYSPYKSALGTPKFSPGPILSPARGGGGGERTPFSNGNINKPPRHGLGVKRALTNYLGGEMKPKSSGNLLEGPGSISTRKDKENVPVSRSSTESPSRQKESLVQHNLSRLRPVSH